MKRLEAKGVPLKQAEAITEAITDVLNDSLENISQSVLSKPEMQRTEMLQETNMSKFEVKNSQVQLENFGGDGIDYSEQFLSGETFKSDVEAINWAKGIAIHIGFKLIISSHKNGGKRKILKCTRGERYRGSFTDVDSAKRKNTKTKACKCTFKIAVNLFNNAWIIVANAGITSMHNHALDVYPEGYRQMSGLSPASKLIVRDMSAAQVKPCAILAALKEKNPLDNPTRKQVYNHRDYLKKSSFNGVDTSEQAGCADKSEDHQYFRGICEEVMTQDRFMVRDISLMIRDRLHPEESSYSEPEVKTTVKGRMQGSLSTKRNPSDWEYTQRSCGRARSSWGRVHTAPTSDFIRNAHLIPGFILPFIEEYVDVIGDGNCGFRVVADYVHSDQNMWELIRANIANEVAGHRDRYERLCTEGIDRAVKRIRWEWGPCNREHWMEVVDDLFPIATLFNAAIIFIQGGNSSESRWSSCTVLPLHASEHVTRPLSEMVILHLGGSYSHYVRLNLARNFPVPPIVTMWFRDSDHTVASWDRLYDSRRQQWDRLSGATV